MLPDGDEPDLVRAHSAFRESPGAPGTRPRRFRSEGRRLPGGVPLITFQPAPVGERRISRRNCAREESDAFTHQRQRRALDFHSNSRRTSPVNHLFTTSGNSTTIVIRLPPPATATVAQGIFRTVAKRVTEKRVVFVASDIQVYTAFMVSDRFLSISKTLVFDRIITVKYFADAIKGRLARP